MVREHFHILQKVLKIIFLGDEFESYRKNFEDNLEEGSGFDKVEVEGRSLKNLVDTVRQILRSIISESLNSLNEALLKLFFYLKIIYK